MGSDVEIAELLRLQRAFDTKHGWTPVPDDPGAVLRAIQNDLIGILGEMGEFANIVKKIALEVDGNKESDLGGLLKGRRENLTEELIDVFIYLIRIASHLDVSIEQAYLNKLKINEQRFRQYERLES